MDNDMISMFDPLHEATIEGMKQIVFPTVFKMIAPLLILFLIFSILKMLLVKRARNEKTAILIKGIVDILFLLSIAVVEPAVIKNISIPTKIDIPAVEDSGINPFENPNKGAKQDGSSEYDGINPFENPNKGSEQDENSEYDGFNPFENPDKK